MKRAKDYLSQANSVCPRISAAEGVKKYEAGHSVFIDVRDSAEINATGSIAGSLRIPRGFIEFAADDETDFHNKLLTKESDIVLVCGAGGMAALSGKTLIDMGYENVSNVGGIGDWIDAGGPIET
ncbi:MAG: rhodanese-like domain-containing protein [Woeseiaceae bacterium]|jgi:rhodanese-related sulfurtransferase|nr:rhodanese-like domain-containing protein [Woeseiaceae bacterium]